MKNKLAIRIVFISAVLALLSCSEKSNFIPPDHIVIAIEENHGFSQIIGSPYAPYINQLANEGALFTNSKAATHPSQPNYLALFSGSTQGAIGDECLKDKTPFTTPNLGAALIQKGYSFIGYSESLPSAGYLECSFVESPGYDYARKHAPWVNWVGNLENNFPASSHQPVTSFPTDFNQLPTLCFVVPNEGNDMHNNLGGGDSTTIRRADQWLNDRLSPYIEWAKTHNSLFILTFDEDEGTNASNQITTLFVGPMVKTGQYSQAIDHYNVLRTIEHLYQLPNSGSATATPIDNCWK